MTHDDRASDFTPSRVGNADHSHLGHTGTIEQCRLHFARENILAAGDKHFLATSTDCKHAIGRATPSPEDFVDFAYLALTAMFFVCTWGFIKLCERV